MPASHTVHRTVKGKVVYERKLHHWTERDVIRILDRYFGWNRSSWAGSTVRRYQLVNLLLFMFKHYFYGFLSASKQKIDRSPSWYWPVKSMLLDISGYIGVPTVARKAADLFSALIYNPIKYELVLDWTDLLSAMWIASELSKEGDYTYGW